jgi:hypothetical protein
MLWQKITIFSRLNPQPTYLRHRTTRRKLLLLAKHKCVALKNIWNRQIINNKWRKKDNVPLTDHTCYVH